MGLIGIALLAAAGVLLAPWKLTFSVDARELHSELYEQAETEADSGTLGWLAAVASRTGGK